MLVAQILGYLNTARSKTAQSLKEILESEQRKKKNEFAKSRAKEDDNIEIRRGQEPN